MAYDFIVGLSYADRLRMVTEARHHAIGDYFAAEAIPLTSLMGPMSEGPEWPAGPAWLALRHREYACVVSDGLSDPWVERDRGELGLGLEVYLQSPCPANLADLSASALADSWLFPMLAEISHILAGYARLAERLRGGESVSLELNIDHLKDGLGRRGVLIDPQSAIKLALPGGEVLLLAVCLLNPDESKFLRGKGEAGRMALSERLRAAGMGDMSLPQRDSVV